MAASPWSATGVALLLLLCGSDLYRAVQSSSTQAKPEQVRALQDLAGCCCRRCCRHCCSPAALLQDVDAGRSLGGAAHIAFCTS